MCAKALHSNAVGACFRADAKGSEAARGVRKQLSVVFPERDRARRRESSPVTGIEIKLKLIFRGVCAKALHSNAVGACFGSTMPKVAKRREVLENN